MKINNKISYLLATFAALAFGASSIAYALPTLQLDFEGGTYVGGSDETTYCDTNGGCDLYTLLTPADKKPNETQTEYDDYINALLLDKYYISIALVPKTDTAASLGSFDVDGTMIAVTGNMTFGTPPLEALGVATTDPNDLASHGIFETYFYEQEFVFASTNTITPYNAQDDATVNPTDNISGSGGYYASFGIDTTNLDPSVTLHFDLYNSKVFESRGSIDASEQIGIDDFAPFSKDAQSLPPGEFPPSAVPEPSVLALFGIGMLGLGLSRRRHVAKT